MKINITKNCNKCSLKSTACAQQLQLHLISLYERYKSFYIFNICQVLV
jgi:hypothetical protein